MASGRAKGLTGAMRHVLDGIAHPDRYPDDDPFPHTGTMKALHRRGLIEFVPIKREPGFSTIMAAMASDVVVTPAGRLALQEAGHE